MTEIRVDMTANEDTQQRIEWQTRLLTAIIGRKFDEETLMHMLIAGLRRAHAEGLQDARYVCEKVAEGTGNKIAAHLAKSISDLEKLNAKEEPS